MTNHKKTDAFHIGSESQEYLENKYRAPALEKGLDVLELLARHSEPLTSSQISASLGRSVSELFRMILALEYRGYITQVADGYSLTKKLFTLGIAQSSARTLLEAALPVMKQLSDDIGQSCHLVVSSGDQIVVIARQESPMDLGFSVRVGYRKRLIETSSGALFFGLANLDDKTKWSHLFDNVSAADRERFDARVQSAMEMGYLQQPSDFVDGVIDFCMPICNRTGVLAVLVVPYISIKTQSVSNDTIIDALRRSADKIANDLID
jgi:DNA-binding IclR family transcriptional regulator